MNFKHQIPFKNVKRQCELRISITLSSVSMNAMIAVVLDGNWHLQ